MAIRHYVYAAGIAAGLALLAACGDEVTEVTNVNGKASFEQVKKFKELPKCDEDAEGSLVYVKDSAKVFVCTGDGWSQLDGADGADGKNGKNGTSGDDGSSCSVKQNKKKTGYDVICDGKTVGSIVNGSDGDDGKAGGDGSMNCSAKQNKKKTGFDVICDGKTVGTITNGVAGEDCSLTEGEDGSTVVKCGEDGEPVTLFSVYCGSKTFDPATHFCGSDLGIYPLCHDASANLAGNLHSDGTYDVDYYFCDATDVLLNKCNGQVYDNATQFCGYGEVSSGKVFDRCETVAEGVDGEALYGDHNFDDGSYFCNKGVLYEKCGGGIYDPEFQFCDEEEGKPVALCGDKSYDLKDSICVDGTVKYAKACCRPDGEGENWCKANEKSIYDVRENKFCDNRDGRVYEYTTVTVGKYSEIWMAENLQFEPTKTSASKCPDNNSQWCEDYGRLYNWSAAKSSCPDDWHLPTAEEFDALTRAVSYARYLKSRSANGDDTYGFNSLTKAGSFEGGTWKENVHNEFNDNGKSRDFYWADNYGQFNDSYACVSVNGMEVKKSCNVLALAAGYRDFDSYTFVETDYASVRCIKNK